MLARSNVTYSDMGTKKQYLRGALASTARRGRDGRISAVARPARRCGPLHAVDAALMKKADADKRT